VNLSGFRGLTRWGFEVDHACMDATLFPELPAGDRGDKGELTGGPPRLVRADRHQVEMRPLDLDALLPPDHRARIVWQFVEGLDLSELHSKIRAVEGRAGRPAIDPAILVALWMYATIECVGSARALDRLCKEHHAYQWLCGGVSMNYHTLSDFRTQHVAVLDSLLTTSVASLMAEGLVRLERLAQDGMKIRASAGAASFRRGSTLEQCLVEAEERIATLKRELDEDPGRASQRQAAARQRAAEERRSRVQAALRHVPEVQARKARRQAKTKPPDKPDSKGGGMPTLAERGEARVSTTDPDARVMKMADGGFRPAYNAQLATDVSSQVIVGVIASNSGNDYGQAVLMLQQVKNRYGRVPQDVLVDGGFAGLRDIEEISTTHGCVVYAPPMNRDTSKVWSKSPAHRDSDAVASWRARMNTDEAKEIYKQRAATAECANAHLRNRGLLRLLVRGELKVLAVLFWHALAHNLLRAHALRQAQANFAPA
jgi:transposase